MGGQITTNHLHGRGNSQDDNKILSDIDREEIRLQVRVYPALTRVNNYVLTYIVE